MHLGESDPLERIVEAIAKHGKQHDLIGLQSPSDEGQGVQCRPVEPLDIVGEQEDRCGFQAIAEQMQNGERNLKWVLSRLVVQAKGAAQRLPVGIRQLIDCIHDRTEELMQSGKWKMGLGLDTRSGEDLESPRCGMDPRGIEK